MGSCISKCKPKKPQNKKRKLQEPELYVEKSNNLPLVRDKLVISQTPISSPPPSNVSVISSSNYPTTSSSSCSFLSTESSSISSTLSSELDRSRDNRYKIRHEYPKPRLSVNKPIGPKQNPPSPRRLTRQPVAQKRPRCSSPSNLTRQKSVRREPNSRPISEPNSAQQSSFRRELERPGSRNSRDLRPISRPISPSPSRRYKGENMTSSMRRENYQIRAHSPSTSVNSRRHSVSKKMVVKREKDEGILGIGSKLEELGIGELVARQEMDWMPIEDANNPHIALDCFIFL